MFVDGARADVEDLADLAVGFAAADPQEDFGFAAGELQGLLEELLVAAGGDFGEAEEELVGADGAQERQLDAAAGDFEVGAGG